MLKYWGTFLSICFVFFCQGQTLDSIPTSFGKQDSAVFKTPADTIGKSQKAGNKGKSKVKAEKEEPKIFKDSTRLAIEAKTKKAWFRSLILPGWGQYSNGGLWWLKVPVIYGGFVTTALVFNFNNTYYKELLRELDSRYSGQGFLYPEYQHANEQALINAKDYARRNRDMMVLLTVGLYGLNIVEAYVDSMLKYRWSISMDNTRSVAFSVKPTLLNSPGGMNQMFKPTMGVKLAVNFR